LIQISKAPASGAAGAKEGFQPRALLISTKGDEYEAHGRKEALACVAARAVVRDLSGSYFRRFAAKKNTKQAG
jgi:hypothetical protein